MRWQRGQNATAFNLFFIIVTFPCQKSSNIVIVVSMAALLLELQMVWHSTMLGVSLICVQPLDRVILLRSLLMVFRQGCGIYSGWLLS